MIRAALTALAILPLLSLAQPRETENVVLITLDGLRWEELYTGADSLLIGNGDYVDHPEALAEQFWADDADLRREALMPFFWTVIAEQGQLYGNRFLENFVDVTNTRLFSYPGYNEILTGFADDRIVSNAKIDNANKTVLEFVNAQPGFEGRVAAFGSWDVFPWIINETRSGIPVNAGFRAAEGDNLTEREQFLNTMQPQVPSPWSTVRLDAFTHHYALEYLKRERPRLVYIAYGETDDFAHDGNYEAYLRSAHQTDAFIRDLWEWVQEDEGYRNKTTFIITTDHGRGEGDQWTGHSAFVDGAREIWIAVLGPDSEPLGELTTPGQLYQNQVAKTVAAFLGLEYTNERPVGEVIGTIGK
jgi:hypothetical protein